MPQKPNMPAETCLDGLMEWVAHCDGTHYVRSGNVLALAPATQQMFSLPAKVPALVMFRLVHKDDLPRAQESLRTSLVHQPPRVHFVGVRMQLSPGVYVRFDVLARRVDRCPGCDDCHPYIGLFTKSGPSFSK